MTILVDRDLDCLHTLYYKPRIYYSTSISPCRPGDEGGNVGGWRGEADGSATHVPVGEDQSQHLETTRVLAKQFNKSYPSTPPTFNIPETMISTLPLSPLFPHYLLFPCSVLSEAIADAGAYPRIASLTNPTKKMSKSDLEKNSKILLTTPPKTIRTIISRALTDSIPGVYSSPDRPGVTNLLNILAAFENFPVEKLEDEMREWKMREFKDRVAESVVSGLEGIQGRYEEVKGDKKWLERVRREGNEKARGIASERIKEIKRIVGLL